MKLPMSRLIAPAGVLVLLSLSLGRGLNPVAGADDAPTDAPQQILVSPLEPDSPVGKAGWKMNTLSVTPAPAPVVPKIGPSALRLAGVAEDAGAKGDFTLTRSVPGRCRSLALWVYLAPSANVESLGLQISDAEGESFLARVPADWTGWKQVTVDLGGPPPPQTYDQPAKNKVVDLPLGEVHLAWFARAAGPTSVIVNALTATTVTPATEMVDVQVSGATAGETDAPLAPQTFVLTNHAGKARVVKFEYLFQRDPGLYSQTPPDPQYGSDLALGAKSWTEAEGKTLERGSLTDGTWTNATLSWGVHKEAVQYVDLGRERTVTHLAYDAGDGNWGWKMEISASPDGRAYQTVPGLGVVDTHGQWGHQEIAVPQPFRARFLRLRHGNGGQDVSQISMPASLSVYGGVAGETWAFPQAGETLVQGTLSVSVPARAFATADVSDRKPLGPGAYLLTVRVRDGERTQLLYRHFLVMPPPLQGVSPASRFGLNVSNFEWAPINRRMGAGWVRFENFKWPMVSPRPNEYVFSGVLPWNLPHDQIVAAYRAAGLSFLPFLFQSPDYATSAPDSVTKNRESYPPKDNAQMADYVFQTVARYGAAKHPASELKTTDKKSGLDEIHTYEIWNEPNLHDPGWGPWVGTTARYNAMFRAAAEAVKRADPTARVTNGGFGGIDIETMNTLLTPYADGRRPLDFVDVLNVHYYSGRVEPEIATTDPNADRSGTGGGARPFEDGLRALIAWRDKNKPGLPIWMSETGYDSSGPSGTSEQAQAAQLPRVIMMALAAGIEKVFVYRESGSTPSLFAASGVMRDDGSLKPAWFTYATLTRELDGVKTGALRLPDPDPNVRLYAWTRGAETILSAWAVGGTATLKLPLGRATVTDAFGHAQTMNVTGSLPLTAFPVYLKGVSNPAAIQALITQAQRGEAARRREQTRLSHLRAYLFDFGSRDRVGTTDIGDTRSFTSVMGTDVYDDKKGYGFFPGPAGPDSVSGWISDPLERDSTRMNPDHTFRVHAAPGRYQLRVSLNPQSAAQLAIKGAIGGDKILPVTHDGPVVTTEVEVGAEPLSLSNTGYGDIRWLSLVEDSGAAAH